MPLRTVGPGALAAAALLLLLVVSTPSWAYEKEITDQANAMAARLNQTHAQTTIAVVDFTDLQGRTTELGRFLAEELSSALAGTERKFSVIDRIHLRELIQEHKLGTTGVIDQKTASKLGKVAGVRNLVGGTITQFQDSIRLSLKVFDSETADIAYSDALNIPKTEVLAILVGRDLEPEGPLPGASPGKPVSSMEVNGFRWTLHGCIVRAPNIICDLTAVNLEQDRRAWIESKTRALDDLGNEYEVSEKRIGNKKAYDTTFANGVPTKISLSFEGISPQARKLSLLEILLGGRGSDNTRAQFRDVPLQAP